MESTQLVKNLRFLMEKRMETANAVAVRCGVKASTMMRLLDGTSAAPRNSTLQALAMHFGVHPDKLSKADLSLEVEELVEHKSLSEPIPLLDEMEVFQIYHWNGSDTTDENGYLYRPLSKNRTWLPAPPDQEIIDLIKDSSESVVPPIFAFKVKGNAMAPKICDGDIVFVLYTRTDGCYDDEGRLRAFTTPDVVENGDFVLSYFSKKDDKTDDYEVRMVVRQFCPGDSSDNDYLVATNPDWPGERSLICERIIGKVLSFYRKF